MNQALNDTKKDEEGWGRYASIGEPPRPGTASGRQASASAIIGRTNATAIIKVAPAIARGECVALCVPTTA
jgi:hypothetical protein